MATFRELVERALELPEVEHSSSYGTPSLRVGRRGGLLARLREDGDTLVLRVDPAERAVLLAERPAVYHLTPHYERSPYVLVHLARADLDEIMDLLFEAWRDRAPRRALRALEAREAGTTLER